MPSNFPFHVLGGVAPYFAIAFILLCFLMQLILAQGVYREARSREVTGRKVWFAGPGFWAFSTLFGGIFPAAIYWVIHHSTLRPIEATDPEDI